MREIFGNLWQVEADLRVVSTNSIVNARGQAVMGRGCAREARERIPGLEYHFAALLRTYGNRVMRLTKPCAATGGATLASFPVKHHWRDPADPLLIEHSARQLVRLADKFGYQRVAMPRPGCGNGRLSWAYIRPVLEEILAGNRFTVVTFPPGGRPGHAQDAV